MRSRPYFEINSNLQLDGRYVLHIFSRCLSRFPAQLITPHRFGDRSQRYHTAPDRQRLEMPESFCASPRSIATRAKPVQYESAAPARGQLLLFLPAQIAFELWPSEMPWTYLSSSYFVCAWEQAVQHPS